MTKKLLPSMPQLHLSDYLSRLTIVALLPILVFAVVAGLLLADRERHAFERSSLERARAVSSAVDAELRGALTSLLALAQAESLRRGDLATFHATASRVQIEQPGWLVVNLALPDSAQQLVNTRGPFG